MKLYLYVVVGKISIFKIGLRHQEWPTFIFFTDFIDFHSRGCPRSILMLFAETVANGSLIINTAMAPKRDIEQLPIAK